MAMMEYPRCGFTQPKDRYCANCGLDTDNYTPKKDSLGQTLLKSSLLYIAGGAVTLVAVALFFSKANSPSPEVESVNNVESFVAAPAAPEVTPPKQQLPAPARTKIVTQPTTPPPPSQTVEAPVAASTTEAQIEPLEVSDQDEASTNARSFGSGAISTPSAKPAQVPTGSDAAGIPDALTQPTQVQVQFFEFPRAALAVAAQQSRVISDGDQYRILLHNNPDELNNWLKSGRRLPGSKLVSAKEGATLAVDFNLDMTPAGGTTTPPTVTNAGLNLDAVLSQLSATGVNVEVRGHYRSANPVRFGVSQLLNTRSALLVFGVVPHTGANEVNNPPSNSPLIILDSADFLENLSEFVVVIQVK